MVLHNLKQQILDILNESKLSIDCIYFMMKDVMNDVDIAYKNAIQQEIIQAIQKDNKQGGAPIEGETEKKEEK